MDDYNVENLQREKLLMIVTSTFGNGDAPTNGKVILSSVWIYLTSFKCYSFLFKRYYFLFKCHCFRFQSFIASLDKLVRRGKKHLMKNVR